MDQLYDLVASAGSTAVPISVLAERLSQILIKYPPSNLEVERERRALAGEERVVLPGTVTRDHLEMKWLTQLRVMDRVVLTVAPNRWIPCAGASASWWARAANPRVWPGAEALIGGAFSE